MEKKLITLEEAKKLSTPRLVNYYKKRAHNWKAGYECPDCGKVPAIIIEEYKEKVAYWLDVKNELNSREHVKV